MWFQFIVVLLVEGQQSKISLLANTCTFTVTQINKSIQKLWHSQRTVVVLFIVGKETDASVSGLKWLWAKKRTHFRPKTRLFLCPQQKARLLSSKLLYTFVYCLFRAPRIYIFSYFREVGTALFFMQISNQREREIMKSCAVYF